MSPSKAALGKDSNQKSQGCVEKAKFGCLHSGDGTPDVQECSSFCVTGREPFGASEWGLLSSSPIHQGSGKTEWNYIS